MDTKNNDAAGGGDGSFSATDLLTDGAAPAAAQGGEGSKDGMDQGAPAADPDWFEKLSAEAGEDKGPSNRDYAKAKGFKTLDDVVKSYRTAEKNAFNPNKVALPGADAKPEEVAAFRTAIGVPEKVDGYEIKGPEGVALDTALIGKLTESALKHGAPKAAFEGLLSDFIAIQMDEAASTEKASKEEAGATIKEWGTKADEKLAHVNTAARALGLSPEQVTGLRQAWGSKFALEKMAQLGAGMAEDVLIGGGKGRFGIGGAEAQAELNRLKTDAEFQTKVKIKGSAERARWDRLQDAAAEYNEAKDRDAT